MNKNNGLWASASEIKLETPKNTKARLHKKSETSSNFAIFTAMNKQFIALAIIIILLIIFCVICFTVCGVSATESGMLRNFINGGAI